jgi:phage tail protein X
MATVIAQQNDRLDQIVYAEYGTLDVFENVLESNPALVTKIFLDAGDVVNLPTYTIDKSQQVRTLW